jgi:molecular chaperone DnaJ
VAAGANGGFEDLFGGLFTGGGPVPAGSAPQAAFRPSSLTCLAAASAGGQTGFQRAPQKGADRTATTSISFAGSIRGTTMWLREPTATSSTSGCPPASRTARKSASAARASGPAGNGDLMVTVT